MSMRSGHLAVPRGTVRQKNCARIRPRRALPAPAPHGRQRASRMGEPHPLSEAMRQHIFLLRMGESNSFSTTTRLCCLPVPRGTTTGIAHVQAAPTSRSHAPTPLPPPHGTAKVIAHGRTELVQRNHVVSPSPVPRGTTTAIAHEPAEPVQRERVPTPLPPPHGAARSSRMNEPNSFSATTWLRPPCVPRGTTAGIAHEQAVPAPREHASTPSSCSTWNHERHRA